VFTQIPLLDLRGPTSKGREGKSEGEEKWTEEEGKGEEGRGKSLHHGFFWGGMDALKSCPHGHF